MSIISALGKLQVTLPESQQKGSLKGKGVLYRLSAMEATQMVLSLVGQLPERESLRRGGDPTRLVRAPVNWSTQAKRAASFSPEEKYTRGPF